MQSEDHSTPIKAPSKPDLEPTPSDTLGMFRRELSFARAMTRPAWGTIGLLAALVAVFLLTLVAHWWLDKRLAPIAIPYEAIVLLGAKHNQAIRQGEYWRMATHIALHGNALHLLVNAYALWVLGSVLERLYGTRRYLVVFFCAGFGGAVASFLFTPAPSVGASGAIFGLLGAAIVFGVKFADLLPARMKRVLTAGLLPWVVINIAIGMSFEQIDNAAHMGGMAVGSLVALTLGTPLRHRKNPAGAGIQWFVLLAAACYMVYGMVAMGALLVQLAQLDTPEAILEAFRQIGILQ
ncbi:MAG: rhomboid family intramembrane serine protease [Bradymonadales bacterium]|nr:rhomboid family intramembrane serine protease [Bradymonadales bacterium]